MTKFNWVLDHGKFLSRNEVRRLLRVARGRAERALALGQKIAVRDHFIVDLALCTGLRVMEIACLRCGDVWLSDGIGSLLVQRGKGGKRRLVLFGGPFARHCEQYLSWKQSVGEPVGPGDPLLRSSNTGGHLTTRAIQKAFKRCAAQAGLPARYSIHSLRHTYACELYKASGYNLRLVQKQLGHSSIRTTEVYADVVNPDLMRALERLYR